MIWQVDTGHEKIMTVVLKDPLCRGTGLWVKTHMKTDREVSEPRRQTSHFKKKRLWVA